MISAHHISMLKSAAAVALVTNVALLYVIGSENPAAVERWGRTNMFSASDFSLLLKAMSFAKSIVTTPHVLTEASYFLGSDRRPWLRQFLGEFREEHPAIATMQSPLERRRFQRLGLADWGLARLAGEHTLVLTTDLDLCIDIESSGHNVMNFNHLRDPG